MMVWCLLFHATLSQLWEGDSTSWSRLMPPDFLSLSSWLTVSDWRLCQACSPTMGFWPEIHATSCQFM